MTLAAVERWRWIPRAASIAALALLLLGLVVIARTTSQDRDQKAHEIEVQAQILAANVTAALDFDDRAAIREAVMALRVNPQIQLAAVYDASGKLAAGYRRTGEALPSILPAPLANSDDIVTAQPVMHEGNRLGSVFIIADKDDPFTRIARYGLMALLVIMAALIVIILGVAQSALRKANVELIQANRELTRQIEGREEAEKQLRQAQKMEAIGQLTGGIAHDFNNMLAIVIGNLDMAHRRIRTAPDRALAGMEHAMEGAKRAAALTRRLLAFARQQPLEPQVLDIGALLSGMSELLHRTIGEQLRMSTELEAGLWHAHADPGQLENAVLNLCINARDAMSEGGDLKIHAYNQLVGADSAEHSEAISPGSYVVIAVIDTGQGMSQEVCERVFEPFFTTKGVGKGTGLGLSQVYGFITQSGGNVRIDSELGRGTRVSLYLPRSVGAPHTNDRTDASGDRLPGARPGETVLIVEDEENVRRMTADSLAELGYAVVKAANGADALERLPECPQIGLLFTDIVMPGMNGRELAEQSRVLRPDLAVLFTSGYARDPLLLDNPADIALLHKPFTLDQLATHVRKAFDHR